MESDSSLIEITGEDDSLLQPIPALDATTTASASATSSNNDYSFFCSPLQIPKFKSHVDSSRVSPMKGLKGHMRPSFSPSKGSNNKENINMNKSEVPKLSVEPLQMKRRKGGGYNLRKSLAWDRAFFTEEGVLNPLELSMLSGTFGNPCGEALSAINEDGEKSFHVDSDCSSDSRDLHASEESLFKKFPASNLNGDGAKSGCSLPKQDTSTFNNTNPTSEAARKVFSTRGHSRTGSKAGGCPRPLASSCSKKPVNVSTTTGTIKESKLPKISTSKSGPGSLPVIAKASTSSASHSKQNQIARPVSQVRKNVGFKSSSKSVTSAQNKMKIGPNRVPLTAKSLAQHSGRNSDHSPLGIHSKDPQSLVESKANKGLEPDPEIIVSSTGLHSSDGQNGSQRVPVSSHPKTHMVDGSTQHTQIQTVKPSGLRMPSPSLGFFNQPKDSVLLSSSQRNTHPTNNPDSKIIGACNSGEMRSPQVPGKAKMLSDIRKNVNSGSSGECSGPLTSDYVSRNANKLELEVNDMQKVELKVPYDINSSPTSSKNELCTTINVNHEIKGHVEYDKNENILCKEDTELQMSDAMFSQHEPSTHLTTENIHKKANIVCSESKDDSGKNELGHPQSMSQYDCTKHVISVSGKEGMDEHHREKDHLLVSSDMNHGIIHKSQSVDVISIGEHNSFTLCDDQVNSMQDLDQLSGEQAVMIRSSTYEAGWASHLENHILKTKANCGNLFGEFQRLKSDETGDTGLKPSGCSDCALQNSCVLSQQEYINQEKEATTTKLDNLTDISHGEETELLAPNEILFVKSCNSTPCNRAGQNPCSKIGDLRKLSGEHVGFHSPHPAVNLQNSNGMHLDDCAVIAGEKVTESVQCLVPERNDINESNLNSFTTVITSVSGGMQEGAFDMDEMAVQPLVREAKVGFLEITPLVEDKECFSGMQCEHEVNLSGEATSLEYDASLGTKLGLLVQGAETPPSRYKVECRMLEEFHKHNLENSGHSIAIVQGISGSELEFPDSPSLLQNAKQAYERRGGLDSITNKLDVEDALTHSLDSSTPIGCCRRDTSSHDKHLDVDRNEQFVENSELHDSCFRGTHVSLENHRLHSKNYSLPGKSTYFEESHEEKRNVDGSDSKRSNLGAQVPSAVQESLVYADKADGHPNVGDAPSSSVGVQFSTENQKFFTDMLSLQGWELSYPAVSSGFDSGLKKISKRSSQEDIGVDGLKKMFLPDEAEAEAKISKKSNDNISELGSELDCSKDPAAEDKAASDSMKKSSCMNQDTCVVKPPLNAVPFSDEWLAAVEAAGEEILTMKSGAVQNSPPDKSIPEGPEPDPWSPVKRTNQIGPFDCTKCTNIPLSESH